MRIKNLFAICLVIACAPLSWAGVSIAFFPSGDGGTMAQFSGNGVKMSLGAGNSFNWSNLNGGDPFDASLQNALFSLSDGVMFTESIDIVSLQFDSDGAGEGQDDFVILFDGPFAFEDSYSLSDMAEVVGLQFDLLNPGVYSRPDNAIGGVMLVVSGSAPTDEDNDGVFDVADNCSAVANPDQRDTDGDNVGNACDADFNQDCAVNFLDLSMFSDNFLSAGDLVTDLNGDDQTNFADLSILAQLFFMPVGPSGLPNDCDVL